MNKKSLFAIIGAVAVINLLSRLLGFLREVVIGYHFGTSMEADSLIAAYTIPNFLYITAGGAMATAFISLYTKTSGQQQKGLTRVIFSYGFAVFTLISLVFFLFPAFWTSLFFRGMGKEELAETAKLFQIMGLSTVFLVLSMFLSGLLNANQRFRDSAWAPFLNNFIFVAAAVILYPLFGLKAYSAGALTGSVLMFIMLLYSVKHYGLLHTVWQWRLNDSGVLKRFLKIALPIFLGGATLQFYFLVHRFFASYLNEGLLAAINYSSKLVQLPQTILMTAVTTVIYPLISKKMAENDRAGLTKMYSDGMSYMLFMMVPATVYIIFFSEDIVRVIFEYGSFDKNSTAMTSGLLAVFAIGMFAHAGNVYITRFFYAKEKAMLPVISGIIAVFVVNIGFVLVFIDEYGASAVAWGTTVAAYFQLLLLMAVSRRILDLEMKNHTNFGKIILSAIILSAVAIGAKWLLQEIPYDSVRVTVAGAIVAVSYICLAVLFKMEEVKRLPVLKRIVH